MDKKYLIIVLGLFITSSIMIAQDYCNKVNKVDSIGRKQGVWMEYEVIPKWAEDPGEYDYIVSPLDSTKKYLLKRNDFSEVIVLRWFGKYQNGLKSGEWVLLNSNGEIVKRVNYVKGRLSGYYTQYWTEDKIMMECFIDNSNFIVGKGYDKDGSVLFENDSIVKVDFIESFYNPSGLYY